MKWFVTLLSYMTWKNLRTETGIKGQKVRKQVRDQRKRNGAQVLLENELKHLLFLFWLLSHQPNSYSQNRDSYVVNALGYIFIF